jgi:hypothetical protein
MQNKKIEEVEFLTPVQNNAVIRLRGRTYPCVAIQGDSLSILVEQARSISIRAEQLGDEQLLDEASELQALLESILEQYEHALAAHQIDLPYLKR